MKYLCLKIEYFLTLIGVQGYSGKADATAHAPDSLVHFVIPIKNSRPTNNDTFIIKCG